MLDDKSQVLSGADEPTDEGLPWVVAARMVSADLSRRLIADPTIVADAGARDMAIHMLRDILAAGQPNFAGDPGPGSGPAGEPEGSPLRPTRGTNENAFEERASARGPRSLKRLATRTDAFLAPAD